MSESVQRWVREELPRLRGQAATARRAAEEKDAKVADTLELMKNQIRLHGSTTDDPVLDFVFLHDRGHDLAVMETHLRVVLANARPGAQVFTSTTVVTGGSVGGCFGGGYHREKYRQFVYALGVLGHGKVKLDFNSMTIKFPMRWYVSAQAPIVGIRPEDVQLIRASMRVKCPGDVAAGRQIDALATVQRETGVPYLKILAVLRERLAQELKAR